MAYTPNEVKQGERMTAKAGFREEILVRVCKHPDLPFGRTHQAAR
jgi:hypothetical protein